MRGGSTIGTKTDSSAVYIGSCLTSGGSMTGAASCGFSGEKVTLLVSGALTGEAICL